MKLRNFLYVNNRILEDYVAAIDGFTYDEATLSNIVTSSDSIASSKSGGEESDAKTASVSENASKEESSSSVKAVKVSDAAKFDKVYNYLSGGDELKYYEVLSEEIFSELHHDNFIVVLVSPRFSKMKELTNTIN